MNPYICIVGLLLSMTCCLPCAAQGIVNGNFEDYDASKRFLAGWEVGETDGARTNSFATLSCGRSGSAIGISDLGPHTAGGMMVLSERYLEGQFEGEYFLFMRGAGVAAFLRQSTFIDETKPFLEFRALNGFPGTLMLFVNETPIEQSLHRSILPGGAVGKVSDWIVDLRLYSGRQVTVSWWTPYDVGLDMIRFSAVPEPTSAVLLAAAGFLHACLVPRKTAQRPCSGPRAISWIETR